MQDCGGSERDIQRDSEINIYRRRKKAGETPRQTGCRDIFRETRAERDRLSYRQRPGGRGRGAPRTHTPAHTPAHTRYTPLHTPSAFAAPIPSNKAELQPPRRVAAARPPITRARACRARVMGAPCGPSSLTRSPRSPRRAFGITQVPLPRPRGTRAHSGDRVGERAPGLGTHRAGVQRGPGLSPPELPWFPGGQRRSPGGCGWPRHPVRSPFRSFRSWLGDRGRVGAKTRRQARWGQVAGDRRLSGTLRPFSRDCPPVNPRKNPPRQSDPPLPGAGRESSRVGQ